VDENEPKIDFTTEELQDAVECYNLILPSEVEAAYKQMLTVPAFGARVAQALQMAVKMHMAGKMPQDRVLDAAVLPAFLVGMLVGVGKGRVDEVAIQLPAGHSPGPCRACGKVLCDLAFPPRLAGSVSYEDQMEDLKAHIGKDIRVELSDYGRPQYKSGELRMVEPFKVIFTRDWSCPFIGSGCAIRSIHLVRDGFVAETLYHNPSIPVDYDLRKTEEVNALRVKCFGADHA